MDARISALARRIGISRLANLTGLDRIGFPVVAAIRPISRNLTVSFGKGPTLEHAKLSAIMEAAELFYSEAPPHQPLTAEFSALALGSALDPENLGGFDPSIDMRQETFDWVQGFHVQSKQPVLVPWQVISMDFSVEARKHPRPLQFGATGLAADFDETRAILHGLHEVVERDCHNTWNNLDDDQREMTLVNHHTINDPEIDSLLASIHRADLEVLIWDMTGSSDIPCYLAEILDDAPHANTAYVQGAASSLSSRTALMKALTEAVQIRLTYIAGSRDDLDWTDYGERYAAIVENRKWLTSQSPREKRFQHNNLQFSAPEAALREALERLKMSGRENITVVRLSQEHEPVAVIKVIIPELLDTPDADDFREPQYVSEQIFA